MTKNMLPNPIMISPALLYFFGIVFITMGQVTVEICMPAMPSMAREFSVSVNLMAATVSLYMFAYSLSHLFYGAWSDRVGRRIPILFGLGLSFLGGLLCLASVSATTLLLGRALQGIGVGACNSVGRSMLRDLYEGSWLAKFGSQTGMLAAFVMASAPTLGGFLQYYYSWRYIFLFISIYTGLIFFAVALTLPETYPKNTYLSYGKNYLLLLNSKIFMGYTLCTCCAYAGLIAYMTCATFILQNRIGLTSLQFGALAFLYAGCLSCGAFINSQLVMKYGVWKMMHRGVCLLALAACLLLLTTIYPTLHLFMILIPMAIFLLGSGLIFTNAFAGATKPYAHIAGVAAALYGFMQILSAALMSAAIASMKLNSPLPLAVIWLSLSILAYLSARSVKQNLASCLC